MDEKQIQEIVDRVVTALESLKPVASAKEWWEHVAAFGSWAALLAAGLAFWIGWRSLKQQQKALKVTVRSDARNLRQKREADARSEWWRRTQWALEAAAEPENEAMNAYGTGMLDLLARSELASLKDKELLDAVWEVTDTEMQDASIEELIREAAHLEGLDEEELAVVRSFYNVDESSDKGDNEDKNQYRNEREEANGSADR